MWGKIFEGIEPKAKTIILGVLCTGIAGAILTIPVCVTIVAVNSKDLSLTTDSVQIGQSGKGENLTAVDESNNQKFEQEFKKLTEELEQLKQAAKKKKVDKVLSPQLDKIEQSVDAAEIRLQDVKQSSEQLKEFVEGAMSSTSATAES